MAETPRFIVFTGLPASGKTTVAREIAAALGWPLLDKDEILESLFEVHGSPDKTARQQLSRESDRLFETQAREHSEAVLCSFWRPPGSQGSSGTPTQWLLAPSIRTIEVWCRCPAETAVARFLSRHRHPGHHDAERTREELSAQFAELDRSLPLGLGGPIEVDTSSLPELGAVVAKLRAWSRA